MRATLHMHQHSNPSCPQKNGRWNGSKVRQTTWEWTHLTISRESLIVFSSKETVKRDINRALASLHVSQDDTVKQIAFFLPACFTTINKLSPSPPAYSILQRQCPLKEKNKKLTIVNGFNYLRKTVIIQYTLPQVSVLLHTEENQEIYHLEFTFLKVLSLKMQYSFFHVNAVNRKWQQLGI